jgi:tetratricopeptide (TPR) repeat protein
LKIAVLTETGEAEKAWELAAPRLAASPQIAFLAAYAATYAGRLERAQALIEEVARRDATFFGREGWTPNALLYLGDPARFLALLPSGGAPLARFYRGYAHWREGRAQAAVQELAPAFRERPSDPFSRLAEALVAILEGRADDARLLLGQLALQRSRLAASDGEQTFRVAELLAAAGDRERALAEAERAVAQGFFCSRCFAGAPAFTPFASDPRFGALLAAARAARSATLVMSRRRAVLIWNPRAGQRRARRALPEIQRILAGAFELALEPTSGPDHCREIARQALVRQDSTSSSSSVATAHCASPRASSPARPTALGALPGGTTNVVAGALGLPADPVAAARALLAAEPTEIDLGQSLGARRPRAPSRSSCSSPAASMPRSWRA